MTKEEALQKVNDYCNEKSYTAATLTDGFKDKFAEHLAKRYPDAAADDETALGDMKFALNSAFSGASTIITDKTKEFETKENGYKSQIAELQKKIKTPPTVVEQQIPKEVQDQLDELKAFKDAKSKQEKLASDYAVKLDKEDKEQAEGLVAKFKDIFKDSLGDIRPQKPTTDETKDAEIIGSLPKVKIS